MTITFIAWVLARPMRPGAIEPYLFILAGGLGIVASLFSRKVRPAFSRGAGEGAKPDLVARVFGVIVSAAIMLLGVYCVMGGSLCVTR